MAPAGFLLWSAKISSDAERPPFPGNPAIDIGFPYYSWSQPFKRTPQCSGTITAYSSSLTGFSSISV
jgi:hypothetical protein